MKEAGATAVIGRVHKEKTYKSMKKTTKTIEKREYYSAAKAMEVLVRTINVSIPASLTPLSGPSETAIPVNRKP